MPSVNEVLRSDAVRHNIYLQRYSTNTASKILKLLESADADIVAQLQALDAKIFTSPLTIERLDALLESVRTINAKVCNKLQDALEAGLKDLALHETAFQESSIQTPSTLDIARLKVTLNPLDKQRDMTLVNIDIAKFDAAFAKEESFYVGPKGAGGIGKRYENVRKYIADNNAFEASTVGVSEDGRIGFTNGRHRYAAIRDAGNKYIPVAMDAESLANAEKAGYISSEPLSSVYSISVSMEVITPPMAEVYAATMARPFSGRLLKEWVADLEAGTFTRLRDAVRMGVLEGQTIDQIVQRVKGTRAMGYKDGILETSRRGAEALVRTAVSHTVNVARDKVYQANDSLIKGVQWVSTLDGRTSSICQSRDGKVFPLNSGPRPPAHINCRSSTAPVLKSWVDLGVDAKEFPEGSRASMNGQVAESETYQTWLQKQPASFQDDILGPSRGKLFREGGMTLDRFVDRNGASLTLDQLRSKDAAAFKAAGV